MASSRDCVLVHYPALSRDLSIENGLIALLYQAADAGHGTLFGLLLRALDEIHAKQLLSSSTGEVHVLR